MFNPIKTKLVIFFRKVYETFIFGGNVLFNSLNHKNLGLTFQRDCKWDHHIRGIIGKCRILVSVLKSFKYRLSRKLLENMYKSVILPHLDYFGTTVIKNTFFIMYILVFLKMVIVPNKHRLVAPIISV